MLRDRSGLAATEFGLIAPGMVVFLMGTLELTNALRVQTKLNTAVGQFVEVVAGQQSVTGPNGSLADICVGAGLNMRPFPIGTFAIDVASITNDHPSNRVAGSTDTTSVNTYLDWESVSSCPAVSPTTMGLSGAFALANSPQSLLTKSGASSTQSANLQMGYSAIAVRTTFVYANVASFLFGSSLTFTATAVARPRTNTQIACTNTATGGAC